MSIKDINEYLGQGHTHMCDPAWRSGWHSRTQGCSFREQMGEWMTTFLWPVCRECPNVLQEALERPQIMALIIITAASVSELP